jgi:hypothetical protein
MSMQHHCCTIVAPLLHHLGGTFEFTILRYKVLISKSSIYMVFIL